MLLGGNPNVGTHKISNCLLEFFPETILIPTNVTKLNANEEGENHLQAFSISLASCMHAGVLICLAVILS